MGGRVLYALAAAAVLVCVAVAPASGALPDRRGYELASAVDKNGGDVVPMASRTRVAGDGGAVSFTSLVGFGDVLGATIGTEYMAQRTGTPGTAGWSTHGITPAQQPLPTIGAIAGLDPSYDGEMSPDLSSGVFRAFRPLTDAPDVTSLINLYVRRDLRTPGPGSFELITHPGYAVVAPFRPAISLVAGASADFSHVIFESTAPLARDLPSCTAGVDCPVELYEWADGALRLAGILPDGTPAPSSQAGRGAIGNPLPHFMPHMISSDGSRVFFQAPIETGDAYMRVNGTTTVKLNASEKTTPEASQGAKLWTASADGTRSFFSTSEGLVDGDDDGSEDYYMYDVNAPVGGHLTLISRDGEPSDVDSGLGIIGAGDDGHTLYFMMAGQLVAGGDLLVFGLYVWHDGVVRYIGSFADPANIGFNTLEANWVFATQAMLARVSADGTHVMFAATDGSGFTGHGGFGGFDHGTACDGGGCRELYVYDAQGDQLRCASCDPSGASPVGSADVNTKVDAYASDISGTSHVNHAISSDGRWVFFSSPDALVPDDVNGRIDAYEYDTVAESVSLLSSGRSPDGSYFLDASGSGRDAFFVTREQLVGWDVDGSYDLYDARVDGGLPEPVAPPPACTGDACQGAVSPAPASAASASRAFSGAGNKHERLRHARHRRCKHGKRRVLKRGKVRCVRRKARGRRSAVRSHIAGGADR